MKYGIYTPDEFLARYGCNEKKAKVEHQIINIVNQERQKERVVAIPNDLSAPRQHTVYIKISDTLRTDVMGRRLRQAQPDEVLTARLHERLANLEAVLREAGRGEALTAADIKIEAVGVQVDRRRTAIIDTLAAAGLSADGGSPASSVPAFYQPPPPAVRAGGGTQDCRS